MPVSVLPPQAMCCPLFADLCRARDLREVNFRDHPGTDHRGKTNSKIREMTARWLEAFEYQQIRRQHGGRGWWHDVHIGAPSASSDLSLAASDTPAFPELHFAHEGGAPAWLRA